jgi:sugar diacid utilization regulator
MHKATRQESMANIPVLLLHEMLEVIAQTNPEKMEAFVAANIQEPQLKATAIEWAAMFGLDMHMIIVLGLHGDGVPFAAKMRDALEQ